MVRRYRDHGEARHAYQPQLGEARIGLYGRQGHRPGQPAVGSEIEDDDLGIVALGIGVRSAGNPGQAYDVLALARMVNEHRIAFGHAADVLQGKRICHPIPDGVTLALELIERVDIGIGLENPVRQRAAYFATAKVFESTESPFA